jgi:protein SFI1
MNEKAGYYTQVQVLEGAAALLRKWRMRVLGNRGRDVNAQLFKERNDRMHFRNIFRYWHNRTAQQKGRKPTNPGASRSDDDLEGNDTKGAEDWTVFDDGFDFGDWIPGPEASSSTPVPGYLSTPSKRAARAKALVRLVATPGVRKTPLERIIFPAERDLRRSEFGKSIRGKRRDLEERRKLDAPQQPPMTEQ